MRCAVAGCANNNKKIKSKNIKKNIIQNLSYYRFPKDKKTLELWKKCCGPTVNPKYARICSSHFTDDDFNLRYKLVKDHAPNVKKINKHSIPSLNLANQIHKDHNSVDREVKLNKRVMVQEISNSKRRRRRRLQNHTEHEGQGNKFKPNGYSLLKTPPSKKRKLDDSSDSSETSSESSDESSDDSSLFTSSESSDESSNSESDISSNFDIDHYKDENTNNEVSENADEDGMICTVKSEPYDDPLASNTADDQDIKPDINELNRSLNSDNSSSNHIKVKHEPAV